MDEKESHFILKRGTIIIKNGIMWLNMKDRKIFWDPAAFRPDPNDLLTLSKNYPASIFFDEENLPNGEIVTFPRNISIEKYKFINIR